MKPHIYMRDGCWRVKLESKGLTKRDQSAIYWVYLENRKLWRDKGCYGFQEVIHEKNNQG